MHTFALASMLLLGDDPVAAAAAPAQWALAWRHEFDGDAIDRRKWELEENCWGFRGRQRNAALPAPAPRRG